MIDRIEQLKAEHLQRRGERQVRLDAIQEEANELQQRLQVLQNEAQQLQAEIIIDAKATERVIGELSKDKE